MDRQLNLVNTSYQEVEKRVFPRFPLTVLLFKSASNEKQVFEVLDISYTGMKISLKDGEHLYKNSDDIKGVLHWKSARLEIKGNVKWTKDKQVGVSFNLTKELSKEIKDFLSISNIIAGMRPIHHTDFELPADLKYWLRSEGPVELFVWQHRGGNMSKFQLIMLDSFIEWEDGAGLRSGRVLTQRACDLPLSSEEEFMFEIDQGIDMEKIKFARDVSRSIPESFLPKEVCNFILLKLGE